MISIFNFQTHQFVAYQMNPENPEGAQVIKGAVNMEYNYIYLTPSLESNPQPVLSQACADSPRPQLY